MKVQGKIIIVTGGADGIGAALCRRFALEGAAHIAVVDLNAEGAATVAAGIGGSSYGGVATLYALLAQPGRFGYTLGAGLNEEWIGIEFQLKTT